MTSKTHDEYEVLADRAERGELVPVAGTAKKGSARSRAEAIRLLMDALTGAEDPNKPSRSPRDGDLATTAEEIDLFNLAILFVALVAIALATVAVARNVASRFVVLPPLLLGLWAIFDLRK